MVQADGVHLRVLVLCPRRRFTSFILLTPNSPSRAHTWRAFAGRVLPDAYCRARTAGLSGLQTTWSRRACIERALSVHCACIERALKTRQGRAHWISWCSSKAVAGRAAAVFGVPFCCGEMLYKKRQGTKEGCLFMLSSPQPSRWLRRCAPSLRSVRSLRSNSFFMASSQTQPSPNKRDIEPL